MISRIQTIINAYGEENARSYLLGKYEDPAYVGDFKFLFPNHINFKSPSFHDEILVALAKGGKWAFAAPRGFAKSTITNVIGLSWGALTAKYRFILLISDTYTQAKLQLGALKAELEQNNNLSWLYGSHIIGDPWGEDRIVINTPSGPCMIMALGAGMKIRGLKFLQFRPQLAVIDDLENLEMVYSAERREKLERWFNFDLQPGLAIPKNIIYIGTILHYHALLKRVIDREGKYSGWNTRLYQALNGEASLWPEFYTPEYLRSIRDDPSHPDYVGGIVFAQEYQNEPQDDKDRIIKLEWLKDYNYLERIRQFEGISDVQRADAFHRTLEVFGGIDPASGQKEQNDNFSFYVFGYDATNGDELMLDLVHGKFTADEIIKNVVNTCREWKVTSLVFEKNNGEALGQLIKTALQKENVSTKIILAHTDKDKIRRARINSVAFEGGFIKLRVDHPKYAIIKKEIEEFPFGEHDDSFDSLMLAREGRVKPKPRAFVSKPTGF